MTKRILVLSLFAGSVLLSPALQAREKYLYGGNDPSAAVGANKGTDLANKGDYGKARRYYDAAIRLDPTMWPTYYNRANLFMEQRKYDLAIQDFNSIIRLKPSFFLASIRRGQVYGHLGKYDKSLADFDRVLSLQPMEGARALTRSCRAWLRATCPNPSFRNGKLTVADAKGACNITSWRNWDYIDTLAAACAEDGDFDGAVRFEQKAIALLHDADNLKGAQGRLALYQAHRPFRDGPN